MIALNSCARSYECACPRTNIAGAVLQAVVFHIPRHDACVTIRATLSIAMGVVVGDGHKRFTVVPVGVPGFGSWPAGTMTTVPLASIVGPGGYNDAGRPVPQVTDPSGPRHDFGSRLSAAGLLARHAPGIQNVKPGPRTWRQEESTGPTPAHRLGANSTGTGPGGAGLHATRVARKSVASRGRGLRSSFIIDRAPNRPVGAGR